MSRLMISGEHLNYLQKTHCFCRNCPITYCLFHVFPPQVAVKLGIAASLLYISLANNYYTYANVTIKLLKLRVIC